MGAGHRTAGKDWYERTHALVVVVVAGAGGDGYVETDAVIQCCPNQNLSPEEDNPLIDQSMLTCSLT